MANSKVNEFLSVTESMAERSTLKRFQVGALIHKDGEISTGWAHMSDLKLQNYISIHAEIHALWRSNPKFLDNAECYIVTLSAKSRNRTSGKPCQSCMAHLYDAGIRKVYYSVNNEEYGEIDFRNGFPDIKMIRNRTQEDWMNN
jgi:deoxycytidylate deaminase